MYADVRKLNSAPLITFLSRAEKLDTAPCSLGLSLQFSIYLFVNYFQVLRRRAGDINARTSYVLALKRSIQLVLQPHTCLTYSCPYSWIHVALDDARGWRALGSILSTCFFYL